MVGSRARAAEREHTIDDLDQLWTGEKRYEVTDGELDLGAIVPALRLKADDVFGPPPARPGRRKRRGT